MINLNTEMFAEKTMMGLVFKIDDNGIYIIMIFINQDTTFLFQIVVLGSEI